MPGRVVLSEEAEREEAEAQARLREIDRSLDGLYRKRTDCLHEVRRLSEAQKEIYDRRNAPQAEAEGLHDAHRRAGREIDKARSSRDKARASLENAVIHLREVRAELNPRERVRPDAIRREIQQLELRQQTQSLPLEEENELIAHLRERTKALAAAEAHVKQVEAYEARLKEAETAVTKAREEVVQWAKEGTRLRAERDAKMVELRSKLAEAGGMIAEMRRLGGERTAAMGRLREVGLEIDGLEREGRRLLAETRERRDEARRTLRTYSRPRRGAGEEKVRTDVADAQLEELMKRGRVTLGG